MHQRRKCVGSWPEARSYKGSNRQAGRFDIGRHQNVSAPAAMVSFGEWNGWWFIRFQWLKYMHFLTSFYLKGGFGSLYFFEFLD
jgi:hypothetical protein